ncbi:hypothetical protein [Streptomyces peucetius]|uniref:Uncharacterized protein n=1 Tax=Streptomyces peucetius TaxID=1950 RepID=A0ABY6I5T9_STRPE|nr:hypothetical protein [Streptomyces peucetius]UYQ61342.1 hypothetical protein OGH68_07545 [Streptomyces peucetius]
MPASRLLCWGGLAAVACGAVLCVVGWYGVSGESVAERQLPYLASATVPGAALLVAGAVLIAAGTLPPRPGERDPRAGGVLVPGAGTDSATETDPGVPSSDGPPLRVPGGRLAHRPDCPLVAGKPEAVPAAGDAALEPCPVCEPWPH